MVGRGRGLSALLLVEVGLLFSVGFMITCVVIVVSLGPAQVRRRLDSTWIPWGDGLPPLRVPRAIGNFRNFAQSSQRYCCDRQSRPQAYQLGT